MTFAEARATSVQRVAFLFLAVGLVIVAAAEQPGISTQLLVAVPLIALVGVPHGVMDYLLAEAVLGFKTAPRRKIYFLLGYVGMAIMVITIWWLLPGFMLMAFLLASVAHFGSGDIVDVRPASLAYALEATGRGLVVLAFPAAFFADQMLTVFAYLVPPDTAFALVRVFAATMPIAAIALAASVIRRLSAAITRRDGRELLAGLELIGLSLVFAFSPPLLAFAAYFCLIHSLRHLLRKGRTLSRQGYSLRTQLALAATFSAITAALATFAYATLNGPHGEMRALLQVVFVGLAAVTFPHMVVVAAFDRIFRSST